MLAVTRTQLEQAESELRLGSRKKYVGEKKGNRKGSRSDFLSKCYRAYYNYSHI